MCALESSTIQSKALLHIWIKLIQCVHVKEKIVKPMSGSWLDVPMIIHDTHKPSHYICELLVVWVLETILPICLRIHILVKKSSFCIQAFTNQSPLS
jgi:hypothetical protein